MKKLKNKSLKEIVLKKLELKVEAFSEKALPILKHQSLFKDGGKEYETSDEIADRIRELIKSVREQKQKSDLMCEGGWLGVYYHEEDSFTEAEIRIYFPEVVYGPGKKKYKKAH